MPVDLLRVRLRNQLLASRSAATPAEVLGWFGAVQAQDYAGAKWALALRTKDAAEGDVEEAFNRGDIVRTHVLRPTWHFVLPEDLRWMLALTAPRVKQAMAYYEHRLGIDAKTIRRTNDAIARALAKNRLLTRAELSPILRATGVKLAHILMHAELDAIVCSGPRRGKQFTYALVDDRCPKARRPLPRDEALGRLAQKYFRSHGPALPHDFAWWSGLTVSDARRAIEVAGLSSRNGYWSKSWIGARAATVNLLPAFDEFIVAYSVRETRELSECVLVDGRVARAGAKLDETHRRALSAALERRRKYLSG